MNTALKNALQHSSAVAQEAHNVALKGIAQKAFEPGFTDSFFGSSSASSKAKRKYGQFEGWVYSAINAICRKASSQPALVARAYKGGVPKETVSYTNILKSKMTANISRKYLDRELELMTDHQLARTLEHPNIYQNRNQFVYMFICSLILTGRAFIVKDTNKGKPVYIAIPSSWVTSAGVVNGRRRWKICDPQKPGSQGVLYDDSQIGYAYLPDPGDLHGSKAPAEAQNAALIIDHQIQTSQQVFFENGIFPSVMIIVGKNPVPGGPGNLGRPIMTPEQRRQIYGVLRRRGAGVQNTGEPAILDGMIEDIKTISHTHREMGWQLSEEAVKKRILSAYGINPFVMGESSPGSYAQMYIVYQQFFDIVNDYLDTLSNIMTMLALGDNEQDLIVFYERCIAVDPEIERRKMEFAAKESLVNQDEYRAWLGYGPDADKNQKHLRIEFVGPFYNYLKGLSLGEVSTDQVVGLLECLGVPTDKALKIATREQSTTTR
jgi:phage portal protein BeeE